MTYPFHRVSRRTTLRWLGAASGMAMAGGARALAQNGAQPATSTAVSGYGKDPDLTKAAGPWPRILTPAQLQQVAAFGDIVLPKTDRYPAPSEVGIPDFIDEWVSAPYPEQMRDRPAILAGLAWLDDRAQQRWQRSFVALEAADRQMLVESIALPASVPSPDDADARAFFRRLRSLVTGAYYSIERNFEELGYIGNKPMEAFPPPTNEEVAFIDRAIKQLGL